MPPPRIASRLQGRKSDRTDAKGTRAMQHAPRTPAAPGMPERSRTRCLPMAAVGPLMARSCRAHDTHMALCHGSRPASRRHRHGTTRHL